MQKKKCAYVLAASQNIIFAAGNVALELNRYMPDEEFDILIYHRGLERKDVKALNKIKNVVLREFILPQGFEEAILNNMPSGRLKNKNSLLTFAHYEVFNLLDEYQTAVWLDIDTSVQGNIKGLQSFGPVGMAEDKHDYGRGFYLTENIDLAKEWAVCRPNEQNGWVHKYELNTRNLKILDFQEKDVLSWLAELMKHRDAADSKRYRMLAAKFIDKYGIATNAYDVIKGWRANASYFYIAKEFVRDNIDIDILEELLSLGGLGIQYCIKTEKAYANLREIESDLLQVEYNEFNNKYNQRDIEARKKMRNLVDSDANKVTNVFSTLF